MNEFDAPVAIVGAGPVGLALALRLASAGVRSTILEAAPELLKQGSKACLIQGDVLEILDKVGCAATIAQTGVTWTTARTYVRDKEIRAAEYPVGPGFGPFINISQYRIEQLLVDAVEAEPLCELRWGHEVIGVREVTGVGEEADGPGAADGAILVRFAGRPDELRFRYLVGADGVRSRVRELLDVAWTGYSHKDRFLITDIRARLPLAKERHFHYDPSSNPGRQLVMHPQPDDVWRIDWQLAPDADIEAERANGDFDRRVRAVIGEVPYEIDWVSTYRFHQRVVDRFRVGRVFLAGDAAHALPPYGSRGMNSGIQDADNLAWKLARVLGGQAGDGLLDTYHTERHAAAQENLRVTEATIRFMVPPSRWHRWARAALLRLSAPLKSARRHVNSGRMAEPFVYRESPIVQASAAEPLLGAFAPDGRVLADGAPSRLRRHLGAGFVAVFPVPDEAAARDVVERARSLPTAAAVTAAAVQLVVLLPTGARPFDLPGASVLVEDAGSPLSQSYRREPGGWWLVRPDGHLAAHRRTPEELPDAVSAALGGPVRPNHPVEERILEDVEHS
jgi:3-(3-hydroxy-phenyl)propionate hydroxylase